MLWTLLCPHYVALLCLNYSSEQLCMYSKEKPSKYQTKCKTHSFLKIFKINIIITNMTTNNSASEFPIGEGTKNV